MTVLRIGAADAALRHAEQKLAQLEQTPATASIQRDLAAVRRALNLEAA